MRQKRPMTDAARGVWAIIEESYDSVTAAAERWDIERTVLYSWRRGVEPNRAHLRTIKDVERLSIRAIKERGVAARALAESIERRAASRAVAALLPEGMGELPAADVGKRAAKLLATLAALAAENFDVKVRQQAFAAHHLIEHGEPRPRSWRQDVLDSTCIGVFLSWHGEGRRAYIVTPEGELIERFLPPHEADAVEAELLARYSRLKGLPVMPPPILPI